MLIANAVPVKITSYAGIDTREAVVAGEYLLQNTYAMTIGAAEPQTEDGMTINNYKKEDGIVTLLYENLTGKDSYIKVPFSHIKDITQLIRQVGMNLQYGMIGRILQ